jgi:hypothetical protein
MTARRTVFHVAAVLALGFTAAAGLSVNLRPRREAHEAPAASPAAPPHGELPQLALVAKDGARQTLGDAGGVVLVVSAGCPHCRRVVERLAGQAPSAPPRLQVVVLEGHAAGAELLRGTPFAALAPEAPPRRFLAELRAPAVPLLLWVRAGGQVAARALGEISDDEARLWLERARSAEGRHGF